MTKTVIQYWETGGVVIEEVPEEYKVMIPHTTVLPHEGIPLENQKFDPINNEWVVLVKESLSEEAKEVVAFAIQNAELSDEQAMVIPEFYDEWKSGVKYEMKKIVRYNDQLYRVNQNHTSQSDWLPNETPALYSLIKIGDDGVEEWTQPTGAHDAYSKDSVVKHIEKLWISLVDGNVWEPGTNETLWKEKIDE